MEHRFCPKRCNSSSLAETVANTEEPLTEILVRVPARPLVRFKCVSKHWLSLISDPRFCRLHILQNPNPPISAVFPDTSPNPLVSFLLILITYVELAFSTIIPPPPPPPATVTTTGGEPVEEPYIISVALAFDPSKSPYYKVVCLRTVDGTKRCEFYHILIYSSETQSWRLLDSSFYKVYTISYRRVVYWNGAINWLRQYGEVKYFHVDEERDGFVDNPPYLYEMKMFKREHRYFQESGDGRHLHLIDIYRPCRTKFDVLEMGRDYSGWFVKYKVDLEPFLAAFPLFIYGRFVVLFLDRDENEQEESSSLLLHTFGKLISYNLKSKTSRVLEGPPMAEVDESLFPVQASNFRYVETLAYCNFTEEECEDLRQDVANCRLPRKPTVFELEHKARELHEDVTKHWIRKELVRLQNCVDWANEKGRRADLAEYNT
ncbi:hypothetical protein ACLB2K_061449 [Fragaria x ananassa]